MTKKIEPCPYCGADCETADTEVYVWCTVCTYRSDCTSSTDETIQMHNKFCRLVKLGRAADEMCHSPEILQVLINTYFEFKAILEENDVEDHG